VQYTVQADDADPLENTVTATGYYEDTPVTDTDDHELDIKHNPVLLVTKTGPNFASIGDTITYTITVQHDPASDGFNIYNVTVSDVFGITPIYVDGDDGDGILELGEVWTYTVEYTIQASDPDPLVNTAIATGEDEDGDEVQDEDDEEVLIEHNPIIEVNKQADVTSAKVGDTIFYTIVVQHASGSDGSDISNVTVSDVFGITPIYVGGDDGDGLLEAGEVWTYTVEYIVQAGDANPLTNIAIVTGEDKDGDEVTDEDEETIPIEEEVCPRLCVDKTGPAYAYVGDTITYTFYVYNTGDVPLSDVTVTDSVTGVATYQSGDDNGNGLLDVNEVWVFTDTWVVQEIPDPLRNTAIATGYYEDVPVTDDDDHCLDVVKRIVLPAEQPGICLDKVGPACAYVGDTITYTFKVYNVGNVPLSSVTVVDSLTGEATYKSGDTNNDGMLDVDEVWVFTSSWVVGDSPDPLRNNAIATGFFGDVAYTAEDDHCVDVYRVVDENTEDVVDNAADVGGPDDDAGASTNDPQDATTRTETGSGGSFPWVLLIVGMIGAAVTLAAMAIYRRRSS